jgi:hypothetical protein
VEDIISKKLEFDDLFLATALLKNDVKSLKQATSDVTKCIVKKTPEDLHPQGAEALDDLFAAFDKISDLN